MATNLKIPDVALNSMMQDLRDNGWGITVTDVKVKLYKSNYTPVASSVIGDFSAIEADFGGYADVSIALGDFVGPVLVGDSSFIQGPPCAYIADGTGLPQTIYGYYVTDTTRLKIMWAQLFDTPVVLAALGDFVLFSPTFTFQSEF